MRIAHVTATFPPYHGGAGTVCLNQALHLARLGQDVTVFTAAHPPGDLRYPPEITVRRLSVAFRIGNAPLLPQLTRLRGFDIIHLHYPFIFGSEMIWAVSKARGIPYVVNYHNDLIGKGPRRHLFDAYSTLLGQMVLSGADKLLVVSKDHAQNCRQTRLLAGRWADVVDLPNGVDTARFRPGLEGRVIRSRHGVPSDAQVLTFVGALDRAHHFKGVDELLEAFSHLNAEGVVLMIVGDGDLKLEFTDLASDLGVAESVCFVGSRSHDELPFYYSASDVVVLPSYPPESFGLVLVEAMACGRPVIAHDIPGVRSVVDEGNDGLLASPGDVYDLADKMRQLLGDSRRRRGMGGRGRRKVEERYAWPRIGERLLQVYEQVLSRSSGQRKQGVEEVAT